MGNMLVCSKCGVYVGHGLGEKPKERKVDGLVFCRNCSTDLAYDLCETTLAEKLLEKVEKIKENIGKMIEFHEELKQRDKTSYQEGVIDGAINCRAMIHSFFEDAPK